MFEGLRYYLDDHHTPTHTVVSSLSSFRTVLYIAVVLGPVTMLSSLDEERKKQAFQFGELWWGGGGGDCFVQKLV